MILKGARTFTQTRSNDEADGSASAGWNDWSGSWHGWQAGWEASKDAEKMKQDFLQWRDEDTRRGARDRKVSEVFFVFIGLRPFRHPLLTHR
jgi:hypothetical protein